MKKVKMPDPIILKRVMPGDYWYGDVFGYTRLQMEAYANERVREALELAAQAAEAVSPHQALYPDREAHAWDMAAVQAGRAIRSLISKEQA